MEQVEALVIGAGPAGLMAASQMAVAGVKVVVVDAKPSVGRKLLMAGKSGLNLTKDEPVDVFLDAYGSARDWLAPMLREFGPEEVKDWAKGLDQEIFTGSSGRVFPKVMKTSPLLRNWMQRLDDQGVEIRTRYRWTGWNDAGCSFDTPEGPKTLIPKVTILALGGASWARLGSDGAWSKFIGETLAPFKPANMGFRCNWSNFMSPHFGAPVKTVKLTAGKTAVRGEFVVTEKGIEGGAVYAISTTLRDGEGALTLDLTPDLTETEIAKRLAKRRGKDSLTNHLRKSLGLKGVKVALLREAGPLPENPDDLARLIKALPLAVDGPAPMDEAISTAGGITRASVNAGLMLRSRPGIFCAGEMLDWEAPTGGYLLTACLATGRHAGLSAVEYLNA